MKIPKCKKIITILLLCIILIFSTVAFTGCGDNKEVLTNVQKVAIVNTYMGQNVAVPYNTFENVAKVEIKNDMVTIFLNNNQVVTTHITNVIIYYNE